MGNTLAPNGFGAHSTRQALIVEEAEVVVHEANQPDVLGDFAHADVLAGEDRAEVDFATAEAQPPALGDGDGLIVQRVFQRRQALIGAR